MWRGQGWVSKNRDLSERNDLLPPVCHMFFCKIYSEKLERQSNEAECIGALA